MATATAQSRYLVVPVFDANGNRAREFRIRQGESEENEGRQRPWERINWADVEGDGHYRRQQSGEDLGGGDWMVQGGEQQLQSKEAEEKFDT